MSRKGITVGWDRKTRATFADTSVSMSTSTKKRCYETHPVLKLGTGLLAGGSASWPVYKADVYVALQGGSSASRASDPWEEQKVVEVQYSIRDQHAPEDIPRFKKMVTWLIAQLQAGKHVHVGCLGGHGRTGTVITAIVAEMLAEKQAIQWVREHYCERAVESSEQVKFLMAQYGVSKAPVTHRHVVLTSDAIPTWTSGSKKSSDPRFDSAYYQPRLIKASSTEVPSRQIIPEGVTGHTKAFVALSSSLRSLWKDRDGS